MIAERAGDADGPELQPQCAPAPARGLTRLRVVWRGRASCRAEGESELTPTRIHNGLQHIALNIFGAGDMLHDQHSAP